MRICWACGKWCKADLRDDEKSSGDEGRGEHHMDCPVVQARLLFVGEANEPAAQQEDEEDRWLRSGRSRSQS